MPELSEDLLVVNNGLAQQRAHVVVERAARRGEQLFGFEMVCQAEEVQRARLIARIEEDRRLAFASVLLPRARRGLAREPLVECRHVRRYGLSASTRLLLDRTRLEGAHD